MGRAVTPTDHPWFVYLWVAGGVVIAGHYVFEYQPKLLQRSAVAGLGLLQGTWAKAHELRMPSWRKEADKAPPGAPSAQFCCLMLSSSDIVIICMC